mgnify:CR=1 FL=1
MKLREIIVMASISVVFGVLYLVWIFFGQFIEGLFGPIVSGLIRGMWVMAPIVCAYIIRKPGAAFISELIAAGSEVLFGSVSAGTVMLLGFTQGIGVELAFAVTRYRSYRLPVLMLAGMLGMAGNFLPLYYITGYGEMSASILLYMFGTMLISGAVMAGWGSKAIADALNRTGVLHNFAISKEQHGKDAVRHG